MKDNVEQKLNKANFPQNEVMAVMYNNLQGMSLKLHKWSFSYGKCRRILCIACKMLNKMTFDQRSKMLINHFGRRRFLRGELWRITGLIFLPESYFHYVNEWFNSVIKWDTGKSKLVARFLKHFKRMIKKQWRRMESVTSDFNIDLTRPHQDKDKAFSHIFPY